MTLDMNGSSTVGLICMVNVMNGILASRTDCQHRKRENNEFLGISDKNEAILGTLGNMKKK
jgi:hypothetical protein